MATSALRDRSKEFAKQIVFLCRRIKSQYREAALVNQLLRCGTSIGANIYEAQYAQSTNDFISKLEIAQKECHETEYWLIILFETGCLEEDEYRRFFNECCTILRMLSASVKTIKEKRDGTE